MYRLYYEVRHTEEKEVFLYKTVFESLQELLTTICNWNTQLMSKFVYSPIDWCALYVSPLEDEIYPKVMEVKEIA